MEALWGTVRGDILYIHAFVKVDHKPRKTTILYDDAELDEHMEDAAEIGLEYLGTIHTHPDVDEARFGDTDLEQSQDSSDAVMGICGIQTTKKTKKDGKTVKTKLKRRVLHIEYWPIVKPLIVIRQDENTQKAVRSAIKRGYKLAKKKKSRR